MIHVRCGNTAATDGYSNERSNLKLYDFTGNVICDFGTGYFIGLTAMKCSSEMWAIIIYRYIYDAENNLIRNYELYYAILKTGTSNITIKKKAVFPCPARNVVNIPTDINDNSLRIINTNGQILDMKNTNNNGEYVPINVSSYPTGTYIYQTDNQSGKFIVE